TCDLADAQSERLPTLSFEYGGNEEAPKVFDVANIDGWTLNERGISFADVDGDGVSDLLHLEWDRQSYRRNLGGELGFGEDIGLRGAHGTELGQIQLMDVDGDARAELIKLVDDRWRVFEMDDTGFTFAYELENSRGVPFRGPNVVMADVNGDGRTDVINAAGDGAMIFLMEDGRFADGFLVGPLDADNVSVDVGAAGVFFQEINGDGIVDVMWLREHAMRTYLGRGDGTFEFDADVEYPFEEILINPKDIRFADLNRDGLTDLIKLSGGNVTYYPGLPGGWHSVVGTTLSKPSDAEVDTVISFADVNGNGSQDVVWSSNRGMWVLEFAGATSKAMLTGIDNGMGKTTSFTYESSAEIAFGAEALDNPWSHKLPTIIPMPTGVTIDLGDDNPRNAAYDIRDGFWDGEERRFGGFLIGIQFTYGDDSNCGNILGCDSIKATTHYHQGTGDDRLLRGMAVYAKTEIMTGELLSEVQTENTICDPNDPAGGSDPLLKIALTSEVTSTAYEGLVEPVLTRSVTDFDTECRPIHEYSYGRVDIDGDETIATRVYNANDETSSSLWIRDRVCEEASFDGLSNLVGKSRVFYGGVETDPEETHCSAPALGWAVRSQAYNDDTATWVDVSKTRYSSQGNPLETWAGGVSRFFIYDDDHQHPTEEKVYATTGDVNSAIVWKMQWDPVRALPLSLTAPDEVKTHVDYDPLGRVTSMRLEAVEKDAAVGILPIEKEPHILYKYAWNSSRPRTETLLFKGQFNDLATVDGSDASAISWAGPSDTNYMRSVAISNGGGEGLYSAVYLGEGGSREWIVSGFNDKDLLGRVTEMWEPCYMDGTVDVEALSTDGALQTDCDSAASVRSQTFEYDAQGRVRKQISASGKIKEAFFTAISTTSHVAGVDGATAADDLADVTSYVDGLGRIIRTEREIDGLLEGVEAIYDGAGRITEMGITNGGQVVVTHAFTYNTLGQLTFATDPDIGDRTLTYDADTLRLTQHQNGTNGIVDFYYDDIGRLTKRTAGGKDYEYFYDSPPALIDSSSSTGWDAVANHTIGRLAFVREPNDQNDSRQASSGIFINYDELGRQKNVRRAITVAGITEIASETVEWSMSGLPLSLNHHDGFKVRTSFDRASRPVSIDRLNVTTGLPITPSIWAAVDLDASGRIHGEDYGNGVAQNYAFDADGLVSQTDISKGVEDLYDVSLGRNGWGGITSVSDALPSTGLNHSAVFEYDGAARLTGAQIGNIGGGTEADPLYEFTYKYDGLQNMVDRTATKNGAVASLGIMNGEYIYGENGHGPRQLSRVVDPDPNGTPVITSVAGSTYADDIRGEGVPATSVRLNIPRTLSFNKEEGLRILEEYGHRLRTVDDSHTIRTHIGALTEGEDSWGDNQPDPEKVLHDGPMGMVLTPDGESVVVLDSRIRKVSLDDGTATSLGGFHATRDTLNWPAGSIEPDNIYGATDITYANGKYYFVQNVFLKSFDPATEKIEIVAGANYSNNYPYTGDGGDVSNATFGYLKGIDSDSSGALYLCDFTHGVIRKVDSDGTINTIATGIPSPSHCALDDEDNPTTLYAVSYHYTIHEIDLATGASTAVAGKGFEHPYSWPIAAVAVDNQGALLFAAGNRLYKSVKDSNGDFIIGSSILGGGYGVLEGSAAVDFNLHRLMGVVVLPNDEILVSAHSRLVKVTTQGTAITFSGPPAGLGHTAGDGLGGDQSGDRHQVTAKYSNRNMARFMGFHERVDAAGASLGDWMFVDYMGRYRLRIVRENLGANGEDEVLSMGVGLITPYFVTEYNGKTYVVGRHDSKILEVDIDWSTNPPTKISETFIAGTGTRSYTGDGGLATAATLLFPNAIAFDDNGDMYIADTGNHCIRKVDGTTKIITTFAGTCGSAGYSSTADGGPAASALFNDPVNVIVGGDDVYIADHDNFRVWKVDKATETITLFAGGTNNHNDGILPTEARTPYPRGLAYDDDTGDVYISQAAPDRVRRVLYGTQTTFDYDSSGRMISQDGAETRILEYDGLDQLTKVTINGAVVSEHSYGYEGQRTSTVHQGSDVERWFTENLVQYGDSSYNSDSVMRHHYVKLGSRLIARVDQCHGSNCTGSGGGGGGAWMKPLSRISFSLLLFGLALFMARKKGRLLQLGFATGLLGILMSCANLGLGQEQGIEADYSTSLRAESEWLDTKVTYFHKGIAAGPVMLTDEAGDVLDERQYEPFGQKISGDHNIDPHGVVNKPHDTATGFSYHGARWLAPQIARWLTPDPPVKSPDPKFMSAPWKLHPYQYVEQNPILFWDPDGQQSDNIDRVDRTFIGNQKSMLKSFKFSKKHDYVKRKAAPFQGEVGDYPNTTMNAIKGAWGKFRNGNKGEVSAWDPARREYIASNRDVINAAAKAYDLPPELVGGIIRREIGGKDTIKSAVYFARRNDKGGKRQLTSLGPGVQVRRALETLGYLDSVMSEDYTPAENEVINSLNNRAEGIFIMAAHLRDLADKVDPKLSSKNFSLEQIRRVSIMYNRGPEASEAYIKRDPAGYGESVSSRTADTKKALAGE
ncbi:MAG: hypothetical protein GY822_30305, partial [Deltaproteobacteria bacterium]|nr:hypothetical protein [Deltaproteobacteria bacterium]